MSASHVFELTGASVFLNGKAALKDVNFKLDSGEFVALLGDNGAGKTTLIKALLRLITLSSGTLLIFGRPHERFSDWRRIGYVPQRFTASAAAVATVREVVLSGRAGRGGILPWYSKGDVSSAEAAVEAVGLQANWKDSVENLSGGEQQRVLIARALAAEPDALILDEPAAGIDEEGQHSLADTLSDLKDRGCSILLVAHGLGELQMLVSRTVVLDAGMVIYDDVPVAKSVTGPHLHIHHHPEDELSQPRRRAVGRPDMF